MHMDVDPAGAHVGSGDIDALRAGRGFARADVLDLAVTDVDVCNLVDSLLGIEDVTSFQDKGITGGIHADTPLQPKTFII